MSSPLVVTLNAGSSSLKVALFTPGAPPARIASWTLERLAPDAARGIDTALAGVEAHGGRDHIAAVGHRIVHGGARFAGPVLADASILDELRALAPLDPDHMPAALALVEAALASLPGVPQVACFDTAFHRSMPRIARLLPLPARYEAAGLTRYGFHGLSYEYLAAELGRVAGERAARGRVVLAHLGSGSSLAALRHGRSVETTMGFTPAGGVPMGTRTGDLDPGAIVHLLRGGLDVDALDDLVNRRSGLLGVSGTSGDVRDLLAREASDPAAADAVDLFCYRVRQAVGALAATLGGVETLVFSGGIGEHAAPVRARVARGLEHLGVHLDPPRNNAGAPVISTDASPCTVRVMRTDEESVIAEQTLAVTRGSCP